MKICINADDFGYSPEINTGILDAVGDGIVTSCSAMTRCGHLREIAALAGSNASVGLHFDLTSAANDGRLAFASPAKLMGAYLSGQLRESAIESELKRQFEELREAWPQRITHIDTHQHVHAIPRIRRVLKRFAAEQGITRVRCPRGPVDGLALRSRLLNAAFAFEDSKVAFAGTDLMGSRFEPERIRARIDALATRGTLALELMVHVGHFSPSLVGIDPYNAARATELEVLRGLKAWLLERAELVPMHGLS